MSDEQIAGQGQEQQPNADDGYKEKASSQGWVDKPDFKGDPAKWVDAKTFVERGENILPVLKERNEHLVKEMQEMKKTFGEFTKYAQKAEERAYKRALEEISKKELQAVADQDIDAFQELQKEKEALTKDKPVLPEVKTGDDPLLTAFKDRNKWYEADPTLTAEADAMGAAFAQRGLAYPEILAKVETTMKALHPDKFTNSRRDTPSAVEFATDTGLPKKRTERTYDNLPSDAKEMCNKFIARGYVKSKEEYVANYEWE